MLGVHIILSTLALNLNLNICKPIKLSTSLSRMTCLFKKRVKDKVLCIRKVSGIHINLFIPDIGRNALDN